MSVTLEDTARQVDDILTSLVSIEGERIDYIYSQTDALAGGIRDREAVRIGAVLPELTDYTTAVYLDAEYHLMKAYWHASPSLIVILAAIWGVIRVVYHAVTWLIDFLHIKELIRIAQVLSIIWPDFRKRMEAIYGKVVEFSKQIGWGADGLMHLLQAGQSTVGLVSGWLGRDNFSMGVGLASRAESMLEYTSMFADKIATNPSQFLEYVFNTSATDSYNESKSWWDKTSAWITGIATRTEDNVRKINDVMDQWMAAQNALPSVIRKAIPQAIWDGIAWANDKIDDTILPALTDLQRKIDLVNAQMVNQRTTIRGLQNAIKNPGDLLERINALDAAARKLQEDKVDAVAGASFGAVADEIETASAAEMLPLESVTAALRAPVPEPSFLTLEEKPYISVALPGETLRTTWFAGDY